MRWELNGSWADGEEVVVVAEEAVEGEEEGAVDPAVEDEDDGWSGSGETTIVIAHEGW